MKIRLKTSITLGLSVFCAWVSLSSAIAFAFQCAMEYRGLGNYYVCRTDPSNSKLSIWVNVDVVKIKDSNNVYWAYPNSSECSGTSFGVTNYDEILTKGVNAPLNSSTMFALNDISQFYPANYLSTDYNSNYKDACFYRNDNENGLWKANIYS